MRVIGRERDTYKVPRPKLVARLDLFDNPDINKVWEK